MHFFSIDDKWRYANVLSALHIISCLISPFYMHFLLALLFASILLHDNRHRQVLKIGDKMHAREWCSLKWAASLNNRSFGLAKGDITLSAWMHLVKGEIWQPFPGNVIFTTTMQTLWLHPAIFKDVIQSEVGHSWSGLMIHSMTWYTLHDIIRKVLHFFK